MKLFNFFGVKGIFFSLFQNVYELVVRHYLACVSQPAVAAETTVEIDIAGERFSASGRAILAVRLAPHYFCLGTFRFRN